MTIAEAQANAAIIREKLSALFPGVVIECRYIENFEHGERYLSIKIPIAPSQEEQAAN